MPADLSKLSAEDRQDFEKRLKIYGLDGSHVQEPLAVSGRVTLAYGRGRESARQPHVVQTTDFAAVKRMVGVDDRVFAKVTPRIPLPSRLDITRPGASRVEGRGGIVRDVEPSGGFSAAPGSPAGTYSDDELRNLDLRGLDDDAVTNVRVAARAFVRGNSELVASYRPVVERAVGMITIPVFIPLTVRVAAGSVLEFGPGVNVLVAYEVEIENGGLIRSRGHLTINCTKLRRPGPGTSILRPGSITGVFRPIFSEQ